MKAPDKIYLLRNKIGVILNSWFLDSDNQLENIEYIRKGLPGTTCIDPTTTEKGRCVAYYEGTPPIMIPSAWPAALTWQDIKTIVEIADKMVEKDLTGQLPEVCETEESYYKAVLEEFNKTRK